MSLEILAKHYRQKFDAFSSRNSVKESPKIKVDAILKNPFLTVDDIFNDVIPVIESDKFYAISLIGPQGKGKTVLSAIFATLAEKKGFTVVYAKAEDILPDTELWVENVKQLNYDKICFVLDDMSYSTGAISEKKQAKFKHFVSEIRHIFQARVFIIYISHRLHSLPPMLRNSGSWIFVSMQAADREDAMKLIAKRKEMRDRLDAIYTFIGDVSIKGPKFGKITYHVNNQDLVFRWGSEDNPGDGRLMVAYHSGSIKIFNSKIIDDMIDIESYRITPAEIPEPLVLPEEIQEKIINQENEFKEKAEQLFPIPNEDEKAIVYVKEVLNETKN